METTLRDPFLSLVLILSSICWTVYMHGQVYTNRQRHGEPVGQIIRIRICTALLPYPLLQVRVVVCPRISADK